MSAAHHEHDYQSANDHALASEEATPRSIDDYFETAYESTAPATTRRSSFSLRVQQVRHQWRYGLIVTALGVSSAADAAEMFSIGYVLGDPTFQEEILGGDLKGGGALVSGILSIGLIIGGLSAGSSEGRLGRRHIMLAGLLVTSAAGFACAAAPNAALFAVFRFAAGLGIGPILASTAPLATELSPPKERGFIVSVANSFWTVGLISNAIFAYIIFGVYELSWRVYMVISTLPSVLGFVLIFALVPESPRFLALQGQYDRAAHSANWIASSMGYAGPALRESEIGYHHGSGGDTDDGCWQGGQMVVRQHLTLREKVRRGMGKIRQVYRKDWRPTVTIQVLWVAASVGGSIGQWINVIFHKLELENIYLNLIFLNCACVPGNIASALLTDRVGRNSFFTASMAVTSASLLGVAGVVWSAPDGDLARRTGGIILSASFFYASMTGLFTCLYVMASELFPTDVRSTGVALCSTFGRIASVLAMFMNGALVETPAVLLSVGAAFLMTGCVISMAFPPNEMKSKPVMDREAESEDEDDFNDEDLSAGIQPASRGRRASELKYLAG